MVKLTFEVMEVGLLEGEEEVLLEFEANLEGEGVVRLVEEVVEEVGVAK